MPDHATFDHSRITDQIFIGTNMCCATHFASELLSNGVTDDISLEEKHIDMPFGVESYLWLPTKDHAALSKDNADIGIEVLDLLIKKGKKIYIHCKNGHGRGPMLFASYLIVKKGMTADDALALIKEKRPSMHIQDDQREFLKGLEAKK